MVPHQKEHSMTHVFTVCLLVPHFPSLDATHYHQTLHIRPEIYYAHKGI